MQSIANSISVYNNSILFVRNKMICKNKKIFTFCLDGAIAASKLLPGAGVADRNDAAPQEWY
jgi:hypothetical protein